MQKLPGYDGSHPSLQRYEQGRGKGNDAEKSREKVASVAAHALEQWPDVHLGSTFCIEGLQISYLPQLEGISAETEYWAECPLFEFYDNPLRNFLYILKTRYCAAWDSEARGHPTDEEIVLSRKREEAVEKFIEALHGIKRLGGLPWFLTFCFSEKRALAEPLKEAKRLSALYPERGYRLFNEVYARRAALDNLKGMLPLLYYPAKGEEVVDMLSEELREYFPARTSMRGTLRDVVGRLFIENRRQDPFAEGIVLTLLQDMVVLYSQALEKIAEGENEDKSREWRRSQYIELLSLHLSLAEKLLGGEAPRLRDYYRYLRSLLSLHSLEEGSLRPSPRFSVGACMNFSLYALEEEEELLSLVMPKTLGDIASLVKYELLSHIASHANELIYENDLMLCRNDPLLKAAEEEICDAIYFDGQLSREGILIGRESLSLRYAHYLEERSTLLLMTLLSKRCDQNALTIELKLLTPFSLKREKLMQLLHSFKQKHPTLTQAVVFIDCEFSCTLRVVDAEQLSPISALFYHLVNA